MNIHSEHTFHIPVLGLAYSIDTPVKVARFGIASVISIVHDGILEQMRQFYSGIMNEAYTFIPESDPDYREKRITSYLNLVERIVEKQIEKLKAEPFKDGSEIMRYFELYPEDAPSKILFKKMLAASGEQRIAMETELRNRVVPGAINVNIMTKVDNLNYSHKNGEPLPVEYSDAMSALRGFALSSVNSAVVFSAGLNPRLYGYLETFPDFFPDEKGVLKKKIILKVSDYRSALVQGKFLAKKGLLVSEFRIESGLNCGGHAFPTEGFLLGPILEEFKQKRQELVGELMEISNKTLLAKDKPVFESVPEILVTVQGGIGTAAEDLFLRDYYQVDGTGWGSPFLLVPEATNVEHDTLDKLATATPDDYYLSHASPLGVPFNNFRHSSAELQRKQRIDKDRPGSPCYKGYLAFNTEFTKRPICQASRQYQHLKLKELDTLQLPAEEYQTKFEEITEKDCLCEGLTASALVKNNIAIKHHNNAVTICPGPNLAFFSGIFSLEEMIGHIYGRLNILNALPRPHMFVNELKIYIDYLLEEVKKNRVAVSEKQSKYLASFKANLLDGIEYYNNLLPKMSNEANEMKHRIQEEMEKLKDKLSAISLLPLVHA